MQELFQNLKPKSATLKFGKMPKVTIIGNVCKIHMNNSNQLGFVYC